MPEERCVGCGSPDVQAYSLCGSCRLMNWHQRPLNRKSTPPPPPPKRLTLQSGLDPAYVDGWNDALDELARQN